MDTKNPVDTANEPVDHDDIDDAEFQDTGVLHEPKKKAAPTEDEK